jgi:hypothetical protein
MRTLAKRILGAAAMILLATGPVSAGQSTAPFPLTGTLVTAYVKFPAGNNPTVTVYTTAATGHFVLLSIASNDFLVFTGSTVGEIPYGLGPGLVLPPKEKIVCSGGALGAPCIITGVLEP